MTNTNPKSFVFVFGAHKDDTAAKKRNISAINTQVAYRAHEKRRERKIQQRDASKQQLRDQAQVFENLPPAKRVNTTVIKYEPEGTGDQTGVTIQDSAKSSLVVSEPKSSQHYSSQPHHHAESANNHLKSTRTHASKQPESISRTLIKSVQATAPTIYPQQGLKTEEDWPRSPACEPQLWSPQAADTPSSSLSSLTQGCLFSTLDPFFKLPQILTARERWMVHFYFREMGHIGFGTRIDALFCPDRDWVSTYVSSQPLCLQWLLTHVEDHLIRLGEAPSQFNTQRKSSIYNTLCKSIDRSTDGDSQKIGGIMFAAILDVPNTNMHLEALDNHIKWMGGLQSFLRQPSGLVQPEHIATVYAFGQCPVSDSTELEQITKRFLNVLKSLQDSAVNERQETRRLRNRRPWDNLGRQDLDNNGNFMPADQAAHFQYYLSTRSDCFSCDTVGAVVNTPLDTNDWYPNQARHIAVLLQLHLISSEFEPSYLARAMFLKRLQYVAECSTARDAGTKTARLTTAGLLLINSFVRQEVQWHIGAAELQEKGIKVSVALIDALKLVPLLGDVSRARITYWLRDWLCQHDCFEDYRLHVVKEEEFRSIRDELRRSWLAKNTSNG